MTAARVATYATVGAVLAWAVKAVVIGTAGGLGRSPAEGPLFFVGLVLYVTGVVAIAVAVSAERKPAARVLVLLAAVAALFVVWLAVDTVIAALAPEDDAHWAWSEAQLWVLAVVTAVGWLGCRDRGSREAGARPSTGSEVTSTTE